MHISTKCPAALDLLGGERPQDASLRQNHRQNPLGSHPPVPGNATPAVYEINGREYVVIAAGGGSLNHKGPLGGTYVAFALP